MNLQTYFLTFDGYWTKSNVGGISTESGIYGVYACVDNSGESVALNRLIYIGEGDNIQNRIANHERWPNWQGALMRGEEICFNFALVFPPAARKRAEAAMIYRHKPVCNVEYKNNFPFYITAVYTSGENSLMADNFTVP